MTSARVLNSLVLVQCIIPFSVLLIALLKRTLHGFRSFGYLLAVSGAWNGLFFFLTCYHAVFGLSRSQAYQIYLYTYWPIFVLQSLLMISVVYALYNEALRPFESLREMGKIIFRWIAGVSVVIAVGIAIVPHLASGTFLVLLASQAQELVNILTICLLLFVAFASKPLGITPRSRVFGVALGLGIQAVVSLIQAAWYTTNGAKSLYSTIYLFDGIGVSLGMLIWATYFVLPEPQRKTLLVPTTSPYFLWNSISEALGDAPGYVAVSGLAEDMYSAEEMEVFEQAHPHVISTMPKPVTSMRTVVSTH